MTRGIYVKRKTPAAGRARSRPQRARILEAAFASFMRRGFAATSTLDIATQAKVSKRELYAHFKNKQGMLEAGVSARTRRMRTPLDLPKVTTRAALEALFRHGRPTQVQLCVLIDRGHRELPVEATFVGRRVQTTPQERIELLLREVDDAEKVLLMEKAG